MKYILPLVLLAGCANVRDNTKLSDKLIIGGTFVAMAIGANQMGVKY